MPADMTTHIAALTRGDAQQRLRAAEALLALGDAAGDAACALVDAVADSDERVREAATAALEELGVAPPRLGDQLAKRLNSDDDNCVYWAATLLGRYGSAAANFVEPLTVVLADEQRGVAVRQRAAWALGKIGPPAGEALDALRAAQQDGDARLARLATLAIDAIEA